MGHALGIQVVAEGIETRGQATRAADLGCDYGQGFLFARPGPAEAIVPRLRSRARAGARYPALTGRCLPWGRDAPAFA